MFYLIENIEQLSVLKNSGYKEAFIHVIPLNNNTHPIQNGASLVYLRPILASKGYLICITHTESFSVEYSVVYETLEKFEILYTIDKKQTLHFFPLRALVDITPPPTPYIQDPTPIYDYYYRKYKEIRDINRIIPIVKHYEVCEKIFDKVGELCVPPHTDYQKFFNNKTSLTFAALERRGLKIDRDIFKEYFHDSNDDFIYTNFNLKTLTTRPANTFDNVNYMALNKKNGCRKSFIPRNDTLIEIDISAYHPTLAAILVKHDFGTEDIHQYFADLYEVSYDEGKPITFQQFYGGIFDKYKHLEFFKKLDHFIKLTWKRFEEIGEHKCIVSGFVFRKNELENMNPQKLFNYILQNLETSVNVLIIKDLLNLTKNTKTELIHYCYDSFLFDYSKEDGNMSEPITKIFKKYKLNYKAKQGKNYDFTK